MSKDKKIETVDVCTVCLRNVWDCTCPHDSIQDGQFITVGRYTAQQIAEMRRNEEKKEAKKG